MVSTKVKREQWMFYRCTTGVKVPNGFFGRHTVYAANADVIKAVGALEQAHLGSGYTPSDGGYVGSKRRCPEGIGGRTCEPNGRNCSLHNYCIAWDVEYNYNKLAPTYPARHTPRDVFVRDVLLHKYTPAMIETIEGVRNMDGKRLFRWLGWIGDYMHWELDVAPNEVSVDWSTVPNGVPPEEEYPVIEKGHPVEEVVERIQEALVSWNPDALPRWGVDKVYGGETVAWVATFQGVQGVPDSGKVDGLTAALLDI